MPPGLQPIDPPAEHPDAARAYAVIQDGTSIGTIALVLSQRPSGATIRRDWWALLPPADTSPPFRRAWDTRSAAVQALRYRHALRTRPTPPPTPDPTLATIRAARDAAGPAAAVWLAAALTAHHLAELEANRQANPPSLWRELHRIIAWLNAATGNEPDGISISDVHYRITNQPPEIAG
jgi:hypothetical protein